MASGVEIAERWKVSYMSAHPAGVLLAGTDPPPDRIEPMRYVATSVTFVSEERSTWVIWPIFSSSDMRGSRSATRVATGSEGFRYGSPAARAPFVLTKNVTPTRRAATGATAGNR